MRLGLRLLFAFFLINGIAAFFVLRVFTAEIKPSVREVMEDMMVDTANLLAELASDDLASGRLAAGAQNSDFARHVQRYASRPVDASIWGLSKQTLDFRIYVTDARGRVVFDTERRAVGDDYSQWRDVARTLRGEYGARATRDVQTDDTSGVMYVAAPIWIDGPPGGERRIGACSPSPSRRARCSASSTGPNARCCRADCCCSRSPRPWAWPSPCGPCGTYAACATMPSACRHRATGRAAARRAARARRTRRPRAGHGPHARTPRGPRLHRGLRARPDP